MIELAEIIEWLKITKVYDFSDVIILLLLLRIPKFHEMYLKHRREGEITSKLRIENRKREQDLLTYRFNGGMNNSDNVGRGKDS